MGPLLLAAILGTGCDGGADAPDGRTADRWEGRAAEEAFAGLEASLMEADGRRLAFDVRSEGAFPAALHGELHLREGNALELAASGMFGADSVTLWLEARGDRMAWGNASRDFSDSVPAGLREGLVIALTRMGVLHNLARLVAGAPPDRADGTIGSWVEVENLAWADAAAAAEARAEAAAETRTEGDPEARPVQGARGLSFDIRVAGERAGYATVWLSREGELLGRDQVVEFPGGEMRVSERYRWLD